MYNTIWYTMCCIVVVYNTARYTICSTTAIVVIGQLKPYVSGTFHPCCWVENIIGPSVLQVMFTQFQYSDKQVLPPDALRSAMAETFANQQRFQMGYMDDAAECFVSYTCRLTADTCVGQNVSKLLTASAVHNPLLVLVCTYSVTSS